MVSELSQDLKITSQRENEAIRFSMTGPFVVHLYFSHNLAVNCLMGPSPHLHAPSNSQQIIWEGHFQCTKLVLLDRDIESAAHMF